MRPPRGSTPSTTTTRPSSSTSYCLPAGVPGLGQIDSAVKAATPAATATAIVHPAANDRAASDRGAHARRGGSPPATKAAAAGMASNAMPAAVKAAYSANVIENSMDRPATSSAAPAGTSRLPTQRACRAATSRPAASQTSPPTSSANRGRSRSGVTGPGTWPGTVDQA